jgi:hypothetical protein
MITKSKLAAAVAALTLAASVAIPTSSAQAGHRGWGIGAAIVGGAIVGSAIASEAAYDSYYVDGGRRCGWERQYDADGFYVGRVRVCRAYR